MRFLTEMNGHALEGLLVYKRQEYSFDFMPSAPSDLADRIEPGSVASLAIGDLQIEVATHTGRLLYVWGYHPTQSWIPGPLVSPAASPGVVTFVDDRPLITGVSIPLKKVAEWPTIYDARTGWVRIGLTQDEGAADHALFAQDSVATVLRGELVALWLRPSMVD